LVSRPLLPTYSRVCSSHGFSSARKAFFFGPLSHYHPYHPHATHSPPLPPSKPHPRASLCSSPCSRVPVSAHSPWFCPTPRATIFHMLQSVPSSGVGQRAAASAAGGLPRPSGCLLELDRACTTLFKILCKPLRSLRESGPLWAVGPSTGAQLGPQAASPWQVRRRGGPVLVVPLAPFTSMPQSQRMRSGVGGRGRWRVQARVVRHMPT
jgi:hypothetical protein